MRDLFIATATTAVLLATGAFLDRAAAADVAPSPPLYGPRSGYGPPPGYAPPDEYGPPPAYSPPSPYGQPPGYAPPDEYGTPPAYSLPRRAYGPPPYGIPYAASPVRPACGLQWRCGPWGCGWRRVCYPEIYARPYRGYDPPPDPSFRE